MPSVPMLMPSETPMVLKRRPTSPDAETASRTAAASLSRCMLHGLPSHQLDTMPTCGLFMSSSVSPAAYSMAWEMPRVSGWVIRRLYLFVSRGGWSGMAGAGFVRRGLNVVLARAASSGERWRNRAPARGRIVAPPLLARKDAAASGAEHGVPVNG